MNKVGRLFGWAFAASVCLAAAGCGGSDDDEESSELSEGATPGCRAWQTGLCDWIEACGGVVSGCREQVLMTVCKSDSEAEACGAAFADAGCGAPPAGCDIGSVVDTAPAIAACESFIETWCDHPSAVSRARRSSASPKASLAFGCQGALGVGEPFDQCLSEIDALECSAEVPEPCLGVLLLPN